MQETVKKKRFRIICSYTQREWNQINAAIKADNKKKEIINHLISEAKILGDSYLTHHPILDSDKTVIAKQFYPPPETEAILTKLSERLNIPHSTLVARLILNPLLKK